MIRRTKNTERLCWLLLFLILAFIWGNSLLPRETSAALSQWVRRLLSTLFPGENAPEGEEGHHILRKLAHAGEFCCLGACAACLARMYCSKKMQWHLLPLLGGVAAACVDETIQCFVPGRGPGLTDVGIDTLGAALGIIMISLIHFLKRKRTIKFLEDNKT